MLDKIMNGWNIATLSFRLFFKDVRLIFLSLIMVSIQLYGWMILFKMDVKDDDYFIIFGLIFFNIFVMNFFQSMITYIVYNTLTENVTTLKESLLSTFKRLVSIFKWSLLDSGVIFLLIMMKKFFEDSKLGFLFFFVDALEASWKLIKTLMIPIIVVENPINISDGLQKSTRLFQDNWGENLVGNISFFLLGSVLFIFIFLISVTMSRTHINPIDGLHVFIVGIVILHAIMSTLIGIWRTALYIYVTTKHTVKAFDIINMEKVVKSKN